MARFPSERVSRTETQMLKIAYDQEDVGEKC